MKAGVIFYDVSVERASFEDYLAIISAILVLIFFGFNSEALGYYAKLLPLLGAKYWKKPRRPEEDLKFRSISVEPLTHV